jgi:hypothetical protein
MCLRLAGWKIVVANKKQPTHVRLPQRSDAVEGREQKPGEPPRPTKKPDPRTAPQDPALKSKRVNKTKK